MNKVSGTAAAAVLGLLALGAAACGSSGSTKASSTSTTTDTKAAFCAANVTLDKASGNADSAAGFLAVLKAHASTLDAISSNAPSGKVGTEAKGLVSLAKNAVATNNANLLASPPASLASAGGDIDTYCGVDGSGNPLPADFAAGKSTPFCAAEAQINAGTSTAPDPAGVLTFLKAHQSLISQFAAGIPSLPGALQTKARTLVSDSQSAIASNDPSVFNAQAFQSDANDVDLYCGQNH